MKTRAGKVLACAGALALLVPLAGASAQELSEKAVNSFMDYAWSLTPQQFSKPDGTTIIIDKKKRDEVVVPVDVAREVILAGRRSAHAQVCELKDDQIDNHRSLMLREQEKKKWTPQQLVYISQLHLTTVMLLTGKIRLVEKKEGEKDVVVDEGKPPASSCTEEQRAQVKKLIADYVAAGPKLAKSSAAAAAAIAAEGKATAATDPAAAPAATAAPSAPATAAAPATTGAPAATGSTTPAAAPAAAPAPAATAAPAAKPPAAAAAAAVPAPKTK